jgi:hypothetical protein
MDTIDLKACSILERLRTAIPGAQVEYERGGGMHPFAIVLGTLNDDVGFPERLLEVCSAEEIDRAVRLFVERIHMLTCATVQTTPSVATIVFADIYPQHCRNGWFYRVPCGTCGYP